MSPAFLFTALHLQRNGVNAKDINVNMFDHYIIPLQRSKDVIIGIKISERLSTDRKSTDLHLYKFFSNLRNLSIKRNTSFR